MSIDLATALQYFHEFDGLCAADGGKLWGKSFCGPVLFVDPMTRWGVANQRDADGALVPRSGVFVGRLSEDTGIANTSVKWRGTRWTMIMWDALDPDRTERLELMAHEAFHRLQPDLDLVTTGEMNDHLDTPDGRFWIQLEWNALQAALGQSGDARADAVADGLTFRAARRARFPDAKGREVPLEISEGLAEYSGSKLAGYTDAQVVKAALDRREANTGFVRSFAYVSGPLYGFLLDGSGAAWRKAVRKDTDLGALVGEAYRISPRPLDAADRIAKSYGGDALRATEGERERKHALQLAAWRTSLVEGPVLIVDLKSVSEGTFDPRRVFPFGDKQTVYTTRKLIAEWGTLTVEDGAILEDAATSRGHVSLTGAAGNHAAGTGWSLRMNEGYTIVPGERAGDFAVAKTVRTPASSRP
ncbi:MAG: hypothetical protein ACLQVI_28375 [Polyangiaceae bacterium]